MLENDNANLWGRLETLLYTFLRLKEEGDRLLKEVNTTKIPARPDYFENPKQVNDYQTALEYFNHQHEQLRLKRRVNTDAGHEARRKLWEEIPVINIPFKISIAGVNYLVTKYPETYHNGKGNVDVRIERSTNPD